MRIRVCLLAFSLVGVTAACVSPSEPMTSSASSSSATAGSGGSAVCVPPAGITDFAMGTGENCFEPLASGQTIPVMAGPQGGFHIWASLGCNDCGPEATVEYGVKDPATMTWFPQTIGNKEVVNLGGSSWPQHAGLQAFLPGQVWNQSSQLPKGTHVILSLRVIHSDGTTLHEASMEIILGDQEHWSPPCDPSPMCAQALGGGAPCCSDAPG